MPDEIITSAFRLDMSGLDIVDNMIAPIVSKTANDVVSEVKSFIVDNWSPVSPSIPGDPPAVVTGFLESSIRVINRDRLGRFSKAVNSVSSSIRVEADYGAALEFGDPTKNLEARPFLRPALDFVSKRFGVTLGVNFRPLVLALGANEAKMRFMRGRG